MICAPSKDSDQLGHQPSLIIVFAVPKRKAWTLSYPLSAQLRLWSDWWMLRLIWVFAGRTSHIVGFVVHRLKRYCNDPTYWDRLVWVNNVDPDLTILAIWSRSTGVSIRIFFFRHHFHQFELFCANFFKSGQFFATFAGHINPMI